MTKYDATPQAVSEQHVLFLRVRMSGAMHDICHACAMAECAANWQLPGSSWQAVRSRLFKGAGARRVDVGLTVYA
jgi:hypothetical protein